MYNSTRTFIDALGGYRAVAKRLNKNPTTLHGYVSEGLLPSKMYDALLALAAELGVEPPPRRLFSFDVLPPVEKTSEQEDAA